MYLDYCIVSDVGVRVEVRVVCLSEVRTVLVRIRIVSVWASLGATAVVKSSVSVSGSVGSAAVTVRARVLVGSQSEKTK